MDRLGAVEAAAVAAAAAVEAAVQALSPSFCGVDMLAGEGQSAAAAAAAAAAACKWAWSNLKFPSLHVITRTATRLL